MWLRTIALLLTAVAPFSDAASSEALPFEKALELHWSGIALGLQVYGSDYTDEKPFLLIQKLPDNRWLLSEQPRPNRVFPKLIGYLTDEEKEVVVQTLRELPKADDPKFLKTRMTHVVVAVRILGHADYSTKGEYKLLYASPGAEVERYIKLLEKLRTSQKSRD